MQTFSLSSSSSRQRCVSASPNLRLLNNLLLGTGLAGESGDSKVRLVFGHQLSSLALVLSVPAMLLVLLADVNCIANYIDQASSIVRNSMRVLCESREMIEHLKDNVMSARKRVHSIIPCVSTGTWEMLRCKNRSHKITEDK